MANAYAKAVFLGIIAGMRSMSAPAMVSGHFAAEPSPELAGSPLAFIASPVTSATLKFLAAGELAADKSSFIGSRLEPAPLVFRAVSGAVCGAIVCTAERERSDIGAAAGALAAVASAFACYHLRRNITESTRIPDFAIGLAEDALVLGFGSRILRN